MVDGLSKMTRSPALLPALAIVLGLLAMGRIVSTYHVFNQTVDEPAHFVSGLEWLDRGSYLYGPDHPPLARVVEAIGPYLSGVKLTEAQRKSLDERERGTFHGDWAGQQFDVGTRLFEQNGQYFRNLSLARSGTLVFLAITLVATWFWARRLFGGGVAVLAVLLASTLPPLLAHAGLATDDMAVTALVATGLLAFVAWLERPAIVASALLGVSWGLAAISKFSALLFLPACAAVLLLWRYLLAKPSGQKPPRDSGARVSMPGAIGIAALCAFVVVWSGYRFALSPLTTPEQRPHQTIDRLVGGEGALHDLAYKAVETTPLPLLEFFRGVWQQEKHNDWGQKAYLLGKYSMRGWWYFFPTLFIFKTPIAFLVFVIVGCGALVSATSRDRRWQLQAPALCAATIMVAVLPAHIDIGSRYILPVYPLLSIVAAYGIVFLWKLERARLAARIAVAAFLGWHLASTTLTHPDYLGYFNELAGASPDRITTDSDIDWGQDLYRLSLEVRRRHISGLRLVYFGNPQLIDLFFNPAKTRTLAPHKQCRDCWVAISVYMLKGVHELPPHDGYAWLEKYKPVTTVGTSIKLYHIADRDSG